MTRLQTIEANIQDEQSVAGRFKLGLAASFEGIEGIETPCPVI
jgi:hypothetical protein